MKKFVVPLIVLVAVAATVWAAAPIFHKRYKTPSDVYVTAYNGQATAWTLVDSSNVLITDTATAICQLTGEAVFTKPGKIMFLYGTVVGDSLTGKDTNSIQAPSNLRGTMVIPFNFFHTRIHTTQTDSTWAFFFRAANSEANKGVQLQNMKFNITVIDKDSV